MGEKKQTEKPTPEQLKKLKKNPKPEKKAPFPYPIEPEEKEEASSPPGGIGVEKERSVELEEICGNLWVVFYQLCGILKKGFEPLTDDVKKLISPPSARCAVKYHVQDYMKDEFLLLGILGIDISRRLMVKKKDDKNDNRKTGEGKDNTDSQPSAH